ncbi:MAG: dihydropteroate synthase [Lentimicrobiaceae bacterium]|nr:dihydropteroate synthase [Lentimicrobiaceae bacterium]
MNNSVDKSTTFPTKQIICPNKTLKLDRVLVMGILNMTPDSFFDGGSYDTVSKQCLRAEKMLNEGADIIDIGAISTRPGSKAVSLDEELERIIPGLEVLVEKFPDTVFSIDTYRGKVVEETAAIGAGMINDISSGTIDDTMFDAVAKSKLPYIMQHIKGTPENMQNDPKYDDITSEIIEFYEQKIPELNKIGIEQIIVDPGFGFGKTIEHNYTLLRELKNFEKLNLPILVGVSRKSMIYNLLNITPQESLNGTCMINLLAILNGADIVRVHDVKEAVHTIKIAQNYLGVAL